MWKAIKNIDFIYPLHYTYNVSEKTRYEGGLKGRFLCGKNALKADTLIMGIVDNHYGNDISQPSEKIWETFLFNGAHVRSSEKLEVKKLNSEVLLERGILSQVIKEYNSL